MIVFLRSVYKAERSKLCQNECLSFSQGREFVAAGEEDGFEGRPNLG